MSDYEMSRSVSLAERPTGALYNTVNRTYLSIAFMEFLQESDSNMMKKLWYYHGFYDTSPIWGTRATVPTFKQDPTMVRQWPDFQSQMTQCEADWYYLSGHHGCQYVHDSEGFVNQLEMMNCLSRTGFFNEPYHKGRWKHATLESPDDGALPDEVYMTTSEDDSDNVPGPQWNPLYNEPHENCRGVMLIGDNSLTFRDTRRMLSKYFPNAVIIGLHSRETNPLPKVLNVLRPLGPDFFIDPKGTIDPMELANQLTPPGTTADFLSVVADGKFHFRCKSDVNVIAVDDEIQPEQVN